MTRGPSRPVPTILAADVGGTRARVAWLGADPRLDGPFPFRPLCERTLESRRYPNLETVLETFLADCPGARDSAAAAIGVAGPVVGGRCQTTNLPWAVDEAELATRFRFRRIALLNDLEAAARGLDQVATDRFRELRRGRADARGNRALIAPGTGLGEAFLVPVESRWIPVATEGGQASFAPASPLQADLWRFLHDRHDHVSVERVLSGPGLASIFRFLCDRERAPLPEWFVEADERDEAPAALSARARDGDSRCRAALDLFFAALGSEAGDLALRAMALGGVYVAGGIAARLVDELCRSDFGRWFTAKGSFRTLLESVPVHVVVDERLALQGAAARARELVGEGEHPPS